MRQLSTLGWCAMISSVLFAGCGPGPASSSGRATFSSQRLAMAEGRPLGVTAADFNRDQRDDLAFAVPGTSSLSILLGNGRGGLGAAGSAALLPTASALLSADFNQDGRIDVAGIDAASRQLAVLYGDGAAGFSGLTTVAVEDPHAFAIADFNTDQKPDFVLIHRSLPTANVSVLLGSGSGGFGAPARLSAGSHPIGVTTLDANGDRRPDLAVLDEDGPLYLFLGSGDGGFEPARAYSAARRGSAIVTGDFDNDQKPDLAIGDAARREIVVLLGDGHAGFAPLITTAAAASPASLTATDLNGDGSADLVLIDQAGGVSLLLGDGHGGFGLPARLAAGETVHSLAVGDWNGDHQPDLVLGSTTAAGVDGLTLLTNASE